MKRNHIFKSFTGAVLTLAIASTLITTTYADPKTSSGLSTVKNTSASTDKKTESTISTPSAGISETMARMIAEKKNETKLTIQKTRKEKDIVRNPYAKYTGDDVAEYAVQFVGNPYVYGGTSLTNGADCSGFVMSVYAHFGIDLPHSSYSQRSYGKEVSKDEMQPGDIVCYSGHVAICIGGDSIVHASNERDGIKISEHADYRGIVSVRRLL